jgi:hypothetical protein
MDLRKLPPVTRRHADLHKKQDATSEAGITASKQ